MTQSCVSGAVLVGGRSRRMGEPKALIRLDPAGPTMLERAVQALSDVANDVSLVGNPNWTSPQSLGGLRRIGDEGGGAVYGVIAALANTPREYCIIVGCDMPFLSADLLRSLSALAQREDRGVVAADENGVHPLHAVYRTGDLPVIEAMVASGERSLTAVLDELGMVRHKVDGEGSSDSDRWSTFNVNDPRDLHIARVRERGE